MEARETRSNGAWGNGQSGGNGAGARALDRREANRRQENGATHGGDRIANTLGWFSLGLGMAQVLAPGGVARLIGVRDDDENRTVLRTVGLREIASGVGILTQSTPTGWLWSRVAGDMMDLALLGRALKSDDAQRDRLAATTAAVVGIALVDLLASEQLSRRSDGITSGVSADGSLRVVKSLTINRPAAELYEFHRNTQNLLRFKSNLESVEATGDNRYHWRVRGPAGSTINLQMEIVEDRPNELIAWRSLEGSNVTISGTTRFQPAPGGRGTEVRDEVHLIPPGGIVGAPIARFFSGILEQQVLEDLRRFKQIMETGEIVLSDATIQRERPAYPPPDELVSKWRNSPAGQAGSLDLSAASGEGNR